MRMKLAADRRLLSLLYTFAHNEKMYGQPEYLW